MRTKKEVINFLESKLGTKVKCVGNPDLDGQCVTLIKSLMEFLGVPDPYKARGHGKTAISAYLNEGIAEQGTGFLSVFSNKDMGGGYGHIWLNAGDGDGTFYESNGQKALTVTKGKTYKYDSVCNFDKYIQKADMSDDQKQKEIEALKTEIAELTNKLEQYKKQRDDARNDKKNLQLKINELQAKVQGSETRSDELEAEIETLTRSVSGKDGEITKKQKEIDRLTEELAKHKAEQHSDVAGETSKESMRLIISGLVGSVVAYAYSQYPILGQVGVEQSVIIASGVALIFRLIDKAMYLVGKNTENTMLKAGLTRF